MNRIIYRNQVAPNLQRNDQINQLDNDQMGLRIHDMLRTQKSRSEYNSETLKFILTKKGIATEPVIKWQINFDYNKVMCNAKFILRKDEDNKIIKTLVNEFQEVAEIKLKENETNVNNTKITKSNAVKTKNHDSNVAEPKSNENNAEKTIITERNVDKAKTHDSNVAEPKSNESKVEKIIITERNADKSKTHNSNVAEPKSNESKIDKTTDINNVEAKKNNSNVNQTNSDKGSVNNELWTYSIDLTNIIEKNVLYTGQLIVCDEYKAKIFIKIDENKQPNRGEGG